MYTAMPSPPLAPHQLLIFLLQVVVLLALAYCLGRIAEKLRMPAIVGELLAGVILGPSLLGHLVPRFSGWLLPERPDQMHLLDALAQIGVLLLVGVTGTNLDLTMLRQRRTTAVRISLAGLLVPLALGIALGTVLPATLVPDSTHRSSFALFLGVAMCVSAIPVIAKTLFDMRLLHRDVGQLTLAAGMVDDTVGWFLLSIVSALATAGISIGRVTQSVLYLLGFLAFAVVIMRPLVRRVMRFTARSTDPGPTIALSVMTILLGAAATQALGMEAIFGAFIAGIIIGSTNTTDHAKLAPLRTVVLWVFAPLFLASAGLRIDLTTLTNPQTLWVAGTVLTVAITGKFVGAYLGARISRLSNREALAIGAGMNARGVVEVVIATVGLRLGVLTTATYTIIVLVAIITSLMAPPLLRLAMSRVAETDVEAQRAATTNLGTLDDRTPHHLHATRPA
jgi:Kef-type K+ transport system membrane component KefB